MNGYVILIIILFILCCVFGIGFFLLDKMQDKDLLINKNNEVISDREKIWKIYQNALQIIQEKQDRINELEEENEKLKHGYNDSYTMFCGGRQNGKQYTALVNMFKKIDKKKVQEAYKEAYGDRVIWCTSQPSIRDTLNSLIEESRAFTRKCVDELLYKIPTKREEMWVRIFKLHKTNDVIIKVKKEDVNTFLHEIENKIPEITWLSTVKIFETKYTIKDIYEELKTCDVIYFRLSKETKLTYSSDSHIYPYSDLVQLTYLPPMRWDLFKKGRIVVGCTEEEVPEFREKVVREFGSIRMEKYSIENLRCNGPIRVYFHYNKDTNWLKPLLVSGVPRAKVNNHKVVYWEDVR